MAGYSSQSTYYRPSSGNNNDVMDNVKSLASTWKMLPFHSIIGAPIVAAVDAQGQAAVATADYVTDARFYEPDGTMRKMVFSFERDGMIQKISVPLLALIPIPSLQIDSMSLNFNADVTINNNNEMEGKFSNNTIGKSSRYNAQTTMSVNIELRNTGMAGGMSKILEFIQTRCIQVTEEKVKPKDEIVPIPGPTTSAPRPNSFLTWPKSSASPTTQYPPSTGSAYRTSAPTTQYPPTTSYPSSSSTMGSRTTPTTSYPSSSSSAYRTSAPTTSYPSSSSSSYRSSAPTSGKPSSSTKSSATSAYQISGDGSIFDSMPGGQNLKR